MCCVCVCVCVCVCARACIQLCPTLCDPMDYKPPGSFVHVLFQNTEAGCISYSRDLLNSGIKPVSLASPALASGCFSTVPPGKLMYVNYISI